MKTLSGKRIAVPETRDLVSFALLLEEQGASVLRCPLVGIIDAPDEKLIHAWLVQLADCEFNDLILLTGEGVRRLLGFAERANMLDAAKAGFAHARKITRGPKPAKALVEIGLRPDVASSVPTTAGIIETLRQFDLSGRHVGVQLYGDDPNPELIDFLLDAGAHPEPVAPYMYAPASHADAVKNLISEMASGKVDLLAFTSAMQVARLVEVAGEFKLSELLEAAISKTKLAAVGPVVAEEIQQQGWQVAITPASSFILKSLVKEIVENL